MKKLLSLPPNLVGCFHEIEGVSPKEWYCNSDPATGQLGSGGGTVWLLKGAHKEEGGNLPLPEWLASGKRIILHA